MKMRLLLALALAAAIAAPADAQSNRDARLRAHLQERFGDDRARYPDTRYVASWVDLNGDRRPEVLVYMISNNYCGTGGCTLFIFTPEQGSWYQHGSLTVANPPIRVLNTRSRGWYDLAVRRFGGGGPTHIEIIRHGEYTYDPDLPSPPASARTLAGRIVMTANMRSRRLF